MRIHLTLGNEKEFLVNLNIDKPEENNVLNSVPGKSSQIKKYVDRLGKRSWRFKLHKN